MTAEIKESGSGKILYRGTGTVKEVVEQAVRERVSLYCAVLCEADLEGADLEQADLGDADLRYANLKGANLTGAILWGALFAGTKLEGANLKDVDLDDLDLRKAILGPQGRRGLRVTRGEKFGIGKHAGPDAVKWFMRKLAGR
jgi:Pentapeptide repeats (8 copies)